MPDKNGKPNELQDYLCSLHEGQWFGFNNKDNIYANLVILDNQYSKPTEQECIDGLAQLQADYDQAIIDREARKASAKAKLEALGLTTEEIKEAFGI